MRNFRPALLALALGLSCAVQAADTAPATAVSARQLSQTVGFSDYLNAVEQYSLDLAAQKENITSAQAGISIAGVRPDPVISYGRTWERDKRNMAAATTPNTSAGISVVVETAGKRDRRIEVATAGVDVAKAGLISFQRSLFSDASAAFIEAMRAREALSRKQQSLHALQELAQANQKRYQAGDIGRLELTQSQVEAERYKNDVLLAEANARTAQATLAVPLGKRFEEVFPQGRIESGFALPEHQYQLAELNEIALKQRDEILVAERQLELARRQLDLARANRWVDPQVGLTVTNTPPNPTDLTTNHSRQIGVNLSIPLPVSRLQRGELIQAETGVTQAQLGLQAARNRVQADINGVFAQYQATRQQVIDYRNTILTASEQVLEGMRISYRKGAASLLELLNAQRTADDVYLGYLDAQAAYGNALVRLQLSAGQRPSL